MKKITEKEIREAFENAGYEVVDKKIPNGNFPVTLIDKDGYMFTQNYHNFKYGKGHSLFGVSDLYAEYNIIKYLKNRYKENTEIIDINIVQNKRNKFFMLTLKCGKCGREYKQSFYDLTKKDKKHMYCNKCNKKERSKKLKMSKKKFLKMFTDNNLTVLPNQEFVYGKRIEVVDDEGYRGFTSYSDLKSGKHFCQFAMKGNTEENFIHNINLWCKNNNIKSKAICFSENQIHSRKTIMFKCECGNEFETTKISFVYGKCRCDECARRISRYEYKVKKYLEEINEDYIYQFKINSCRDILPLPFDFQLKKYNALIEVDGEGHEKPCNFNQISNDDAMKTYLITKKHDKIKNDYCAKYNIPLLRISYKDINNSENYKQIINNFINNL